jgi:trimeric autotransporter adhesin
MKKRSTITGFAFGICMFFLFGLNYVAAQTYFAGVSAGTGNTGIYVTGVGTAVLSWNNSGSGNSGLGSFALRNNTTGSFNSAFGSQALQLNTIGTGNTAAGRAALYANSLGNGNTAIGYNALADNTTGDYNIAIGENSLSGNTTASANIAIGKFVLIANNGIFNTAIGNYSCYKNGSGNYNAILGAYGLYKNISGNSNTAVGYNSLYGNTIGSNNVAIGAGSGNSYTSYTRCTFLGNGTDAAVNALSNATAIGNGATVDSSNKVVIGNTSVISIGGQVGWTTYSDQQLKTNINKSNLGLDFIMALNPVTYNYKAEGQKDILYTGLIAQEVNEAAKRAGVPFSGVDKNGQLWGIRYGELTVPLIKAIQEMEEKHKDEIELLKSRIEKLEAAILQKNEMTTSGTDLSFLYQNQPNPFNSATTIRYTLHNKMGVLVIRDLNGQVLKQVNLTTAKGTVTIQAGELPAGTYTYSLVINGACADTKLMVLSK